MFLYRGEAGMLLRRKSLHSKTAEFVFLGIVIRLYLHGKSGRLD